MLVNDIAPTITEHQPLGLTVFGGLRAERERWFSAAFVEPLNFEEIAGPNSILLFGEPGIGKTGVSTALRAYSHDETGYPRRLLVNWRPNLQSKAPDDVMGHLEQIYDNCALALVHHLAAYPERWPDLPEWAQNSLAWYVQKYLRGDVVTRLGLLRENSPPAANEVLEQVLSRPVRPVLYDPAEPCDIATELAKAITPLGLASVWIILDELEDYTEKFYQKFVTILVHFLSALDLFERPDQVVYKVFLPDTLKADLSKASARTRRRLESVNVVWTGSLLAAMLEKRLQLATGQPDFSLADFCKAPNWVEWFEKAAGLNPREWLMMARPLVETYFQGAGKPISAKAWKQLRADRPPYFFIDTDTRHIFVGLREIPYEKLPQQGYEVLRYLYDHEGETIPKTDLYYLAYLQQPSVPSPQDDAYELPPNYEGLMDTLIYRLRRVIEPDPTKPVLLITVRGHGLRLNIRW